VTDQSQNNKDTVMITSFRHGRYGLALLLAIIWPMSVYATDDEDISAEELAAKSIAVDERIFSDDWNDVPFDTRFFTYTPEQIREKWDYLMRGLRAPYPSPELIAYTLEKYPGLSRDVAPELKADPQKLHDESIRIWQLFFAGRFQQAREEGRKLGAYGMMPGAFAQALYAIYLADRKSVKDMMLQDIINAADAYDDEITAMMGDERQDIKELAAFTVMGRAYAMGRIAEEAPVPVAVARGYLRKVKEAADQVLELVPDHPFGFAFLAGIDSGIMRRVGKLTGRLTYGARSTTVERAFADALEQVPNVSVLHYEYANALIYMNRKRELNTAMRHLERATRIRPSFAMEALDAMYAYKRLQEIRLYALNYRSFRDFEKERFAFTRKTDRNLTSILTPPLNMSMLKKPQQYELAAP
jgi:tetratricopeptide (TPR) repeat protein